MTESKNIKSSIIPKIASGFCGGISRTCSICGAVSGGILAINIFYGRSSPEESIDPCFNAVRKFIASFEKEFGTTSCQQLINCDLGTEEGQAYFKNYRMIDKCYKITGKAAELAVSIIDEYTENIKKVLEI